MEQDLLNQGVILMLAGMGTVFVFLALLVAVVSLMSAAVKRLGAAVTVADATDEEVAAIAAAIAKHRQQ